MTFGEAVPTRIILCKVESIFARNFITYIYTDIYTDAYTDVLSPLINVITKK